LLVAVEAVKHGLVRGRHAVGVFLLEVGEQALGFVLVQIADGRDLHFLVGIENVPHGAATTAAAADDADVDGVAALSEEVAVEHEAAGGNGPGGQEVATID